MNRKERFESILKTRNINSNQDLLIKISKVQGVDDPYDFAKKEKGNFSKKISGERNFNEKDIIALEKIMNMKFIDMIEEPTNLSDLPYEIENLKYIAYCNDEQKVTEFVGKYGETILLKTDEFSKTYIDYVLEYKSYNCLRKLLIDNDISINYIGMFISNNHSIIGNFRGDEILYNVISMICEKDDVEIFNQVCDPFDYCSLLYNCDKYFEKENILKCIAETDKILDSIFDYEEIELNELGTNIDDSGYFVNLIAQNVFNYMMVNFKSYRRKIKDKLPKMIRINKTIKEELLTKNIKYTDLEGVIYHNLIPYAIMYTFNNTILPEVDKEIKGLIIELNKPVNAVLANEEITLFGKIESIKDGKIYKISSANDIQYEMMKRFNEIQYRGIPKLYEIDKDGIDIIEYYETHQTISSPEKLYNLGQYLRNYHDKCKEILNSDKVYLHNNLTMTNIAFINNEVEAITNWSKCSIGDPIKDILNVILFNTTIADYPRIDDDVYEYINAFLEGYDIEIENLGDRLLEYIDSKVQEIGSNKKQFSELYQAYKYAYVFVEINIEELNGGE